MAGFWGTWFGWLKPCLPLGTAHTRTQEWTKECTHLYVHLCMHADMQERTHAWTNERTDARTHANELTHAWMNERTQHANELTHAHTNERTMGELEQGDVQFPFFIVNTYLDSVFSWLSGTPCPGLTVISDEDRDKGKAGGYSSSEIRSRT